MRPLAPVSPVTPLAPVSPVAPAEGEQVSSRVLWCPSGCSLCQNSKAGGGYSCEAEEETHL